MAALLKALGITTDLDDDDREALSIAVDFGLDLSFLTK